MTYYSKLIWLTQVSDKYYGFPVINLPLKMKKDSRIFWWEEMVSIYSLVFMPPYQKIRGAYCFTVVCLSAQT